MSLTIQEVNYYNTLVSKGQALKIICPFDEDKNFPDTVISRIDESDNVFFYCLGCSSSFYPGINLI